jgi:hypothetical protein
MLAALLRTSAIALGLAAMLAGCELLVELDRSAADAGGDAGCPICSDGFPDEDADAGAEDALPAETGAPPADAHKEGAVTDSGGKEGG